MINLNRYHQLLGVSKRAGLIQIKNAYLEKSKESHQNYYTSEEAKEEFINLTEAYEVMSEKVQKQLKSKKFDYETWYRTVKNKASNYADKDYDTFVKFINEDVMYQAVHRVVYTIGFFFACLSSLIIIVMLLLYGSWITLIKFSGILALLGRMIYITSSYLNIPRFFESLYILSKSVMLRVMIMVFVNFYFFMEIATLTLIPIKISLLLYIVAALLAFVFFRWIRPLEDKSYQSVYVVGVAPFLVNFLLCINFYITTSTVEEIYDIKKDSTPIKLFDKGEEQYEEYGGMRTFLHPEGKKIRYNISRGILGLRVVTDYEFLDE